MGWPAGRSAAGYRLYSEADLERVQLIRYYRELGFPLDEIAVILDADAALRAAPGLVLAAVVSLLWIGPDREGTIRRCS